MAEHEVPLIFDCSGDHLVGILHHGTSKPRQGVVIIVGGPQYRAGSHREFVLIARNLAESGIPVLRFDSRGMGDSGGQRRTFSDLQVDIRAAIDRMFTELPSIEKIVLLGLCDAASAALIYAPHDERVAGLILMNPWIRTEAGVARYPLRHYYFPRLLQRSLWRKLFSGELTFRSSIREFADAVKAAIAWRRNALRGQETNPEFLDRMLAGLESFGNPILLLISGADLTGREFLELSSSDTRWRRAIGRTEVTTRVFPNADHTMSLRANLDSAVAECIAWIQ